LTTHLELLTYLNDGSISSSAQARKHTKQHKVKNDAIKIKSEKLPK